MRNSLKTHFSHLLIFIYLAVQFPQGRLPSHLVFRARHRSHEAHSCIAPAVVAALLTVFSTAMSVEGFIILNQFRGLLILSLKYKPIGASPGRDYVLMMMVLF